MEQEHTHSGAVRAAHWLNAAAVLALLWTGGALLAHRPIYTPLIHLLPAGFWNALAAPLGRSAFRLHEYAGAFLALNGLIYAVRLLAGGTWRRIFPQGRAWLRDAALATVDEIRRPAKSMEPLRYNAAQRLAYTGVLAGASVMVLTGFAMWFRHQAPWLLAGLGGIHVVLPLHVALAISLLGFMAVHLVQVARAGLPTIRSMTVGNAERARQRAFSRTLRES